MPSDAGYVEQLRDDLGKLTRALDGLKNVQAMTAAPDLGSTMKIHLDLIREVQRHVDVLEPPPGLEQIHEESLEASTTLAEAAELTSAALAEREPLKLDQASGLWQRGDEEANAAALALGSFIIGRMTAELGFPGVYAVKIGDRNIAQGCTVCRQPLCFDGNRMSA